MGSLCVNKGNASCICNVLVIKLYVDTSICYTGPYALFTQNNWIKKMTGEHWVGSSYVQSEFELGDLRRQWEPWKSSSGEKHEELKVNKREST